MLAFAVTCHSRCGEANRHCTPPAHDNEYRWRFYNFRCRRFVSAAYHTAYEVAIRLPADRALLLLRPASHRIRDGSL